MLSFYRLLQRFSHSWSCRANYSVRSMALRNARVAVCSIWNRSGGGRVINRATVSQYRERAVRLHAATSQVYAAFERAGPFDVDPLMSLTLLPAFRSLSALSLYPSSTPCSYHPGMGIYLCTYPFLASIHLPLKPIFLSLSLHSIFLSVLHIRLGYLGSSGNRVAVLSKIICSF